MSEQSASRDEVLRADARTLPPPRRSAPAFGWWLLALVMLAAAAAGWWYRQSLAPDAAPPSAAAPAEAPDAAAPVTAASAPAPATLPPAAVPEPAPATAPLALADVPQALAALVGPDALRERLIGDDFVRRLVATVDNLARDHAPARLWPAKPTPGRYQVIGQGGGRLHADPDNGARYTPLVLLAEQVDKRAVVALYARLLPLLQQAYEQLGYPGQRFHTRLLTVIDHLLAAPNPPQPLGLTLVEVKGEVPSQQPWQRYEFADPALEAASAGHKLMMRVGEVNERRLKTQLRALRAELVRQAGG